MCRYWILQSLHLRFMLFFFFFSKDMSCKAVIHPAAVQGCIKGVVPIHPGLPQHFGEPLWFGVESARRAFKGWREATVVGGCGLIHDAFELCSPCRHQIFCLWSNHAGKNWVSGTGWCFGIFCLLLWRNRHCWSSIKKGGGNDLGDYLHIYIKWPVFI